MYNLRNLRVGLANVAPTTNAKGLVVNGVREAYETDANGNRTDIVKEYIIDCAGYRGATLPVKFPVSIKDKFLSLKHDLDTSDVMVTISFKNLKLTPFALLTKQNTVLSGVSAKADDFEILSSNADDILLDEDIIM